MISLLCPTRGRADWLRRMVSSALKTATGDIEFCFYVDDDDLDHAELARGFGKVMVGPRITHSDCWNKAAELADGDLLMLAADDLVFRTKGWDEAFAEAMPPDGIAYVHGRDGLHDFRLGTHGCISRTWMETLGYFTAPYFCGDYADLWLHDLAEAIGRRVYLEDVLIEHMHPAAGKAEWDLTHAERLARMEREDPGAIYQARAAERARDAEKLAAVIE